MTSFTTTTASVTSVSDDTVLSDELRTIAMAPRHNPTVDDGVVPPTTLLARQAPYRRDR
jgi:hypothetical protein